MSLTIDGSTALQGGFGVVEHSTRVSNGKIDSIRLKSHDQNMSIQWDASGRLSDMKVMSRGLGIQPVEINFNGEHGVEVMVGNKPAQPEIAKKALETAAALTRHLAYVNLLAHHMGEFPAAITAASQATQALQAALATPMVSSRSNLGALRTRADDVVLQHHGTAVATNNTANVMQRPTLKGAPTIGA